MTPVSSHKCGSFCKWFLSRNIFFVCLSTAWENYMYHRCQSPGEKQYFQVRMVINSQVVMPMLVPIDVWKNCIAFSNLLIWSTYNRVGLRKVQVESSKFWGETIIYKGLLTFSKVVAGHNHLWHYHYHYCYHHHVERAWYILAVLRKYMHPKP